MADSPEEKKTPKPLRSFRGWIKRFLVPVVIVVALILLVPWLIQRSYNSPRRQQQFQSWLDENLNADVLELDHLRVRFNLVRPSRFYVYGLEVEHPLPTFPGVFLAFRELVAYVPSYAIFHLYPGVLNLNLQHLRIGLEENEAGEWSSDGLMAPLSRRIVSFPFPQPWLSGFHANIEGGSLTLSRRGRQLELMLDLMVESGRDSRKIVVLPANLPFRLTTNDSSEVSEGIIRLERATSLFSLTPDGQVQFDPGQTEFKVENLPLSSLPFFLNGVPRIVFPGFYSGLIRLNSDAEDPFLKLEGEIRDAPLAIFGLPGSTPLRLDLPLGKSGLGRQAKVHLGSSGYGGFNINATLNTEGSPTRLEFKGDIVSLENLASLLAGGGWPEWLSAMTPALVWQADKWRGFGWEGDDFNFTLTRSPGGINLVGEAALLGGRIKVGMGPGDDSRGLVSILAGRIDSEVTASRLSALLPEIWRPLLTGGVASLSWRGPIPTSERTDFPFDLSIVFSRPNLDFPGSGSAWRGWLGLAEAVAEALPEWGGDSAPLRELSQTESLGLEQLSLVVERNEEKEIRAEFVAQDLTGGESRGWMVFPAYTAAGEGWAEGEIAFFGPIPLVRAATEASPRLGELLGLLAGSAEGLRASFIFDPERGFKFNCLFLEDARRLEQELQSDRTQP